MNEPDDPYEFWDHPSEDIYTIADGEPVECGVAHSDGRQEKVTVHWRTGI